MEINRMALKAQTLRGVFSKYFSAVGEDKFNSLWRDLDRKTQIKWIDAAQLIDELYNQRNPMSRGFDAGTRFIQRIFRKRVGVIQELKAPKNGD